MVVFVNEGGENEGGDEVIQQQSSTAAAKRRRWPQKQQALDSMIIADPKEIPVPPRDLQRLGGLECDEGGPS